MVDSVRRGAGSRVSGKQAPKAERGGEVADLRKGMLRRTLDLGHATDAFTRGLEESKLQRSAGKVKGRMMRKFEKRVRFWTPALLIPEAITGNPVAMGLASYNGVNAALEGGTRLAAAHQRMKNPDADGRLQEVAAQTKGYTKEHWDKSVETWGPLLVSVAAFRGNLVAQYIGLAGIVDGAIEGSVRGSAAIQRGVKHEAVTSQIGSQEVQALVDQAVKGDDFERAVLGGFARKLQSHPKLTDDAKDSLAGLVELGGQVELPEAQAQLAADLADFYFGFQSVLAGQAEGAPSIKAFAKLPDFVQEDLRPLFVRFDPPGLKPGQARLSDIVFDALKQGGEVELLNAK